MANSAGSYFLTDISINMPDFSRREEEKCLYGRPSSQLLKLGQIGMSSDLNSRKNDKRSYIVQKRLQFLLEKDFELI